MTDHELEEALKNSVRVERESTAEVLRFLLEAESRSLYLKRGCTSMWAYCTEKLGYSEPEAQLRLQAMRLIRTVPAAEARFERGELSLTVAAQIQGAVRREELGEVQAQELVEQLSGSSKRKVEQKLAILFPEAPKPEKARPISESHVEIRFTVTTEEAALIQEVMNKRAHTNFERQYGKLLMDLVRKELKAPKKRAAPLLRPGKARARMARDSAPPWGGAELGRPRGSRYIPSGIRRTVWKRDEGSCQYIDPASGHRCRSRHGVQFDHIQPWAEGGTHDPENLRLLCGAHNRWRHARERSDSA